MNKHHLCTNLSIWRWKLEVRKKTALNGTFTCRKLYLNFNYYIQISCSSWGFLSLWWPPWCAGSRLPPRERDRRRRALRWGWNVDCREPRLVQLNALTFDMQWFICRLLRLTSISSLPKSPLSWIQATGWPWWYIFKLLQPNRIQIIRKLTSNLFSPNLCSLFNWLSTSWIWNW